MAEALPAARETIGLQVQAIAGHDTSARLAGIAAPTLVIHGTVDRVLGYPNGPLVTSLIPGARLETFEEVGHMFWWEQPERSAERVREHALAPA
jgi:pimeloyl-ACP methyl ester carboxylesterase